VTAAGPQPRIFISYRRDDSQGFARSIHDRLAQRFGPEAVFRDINDIEPGLPWEQAIDEALASCDVFVLLIGRHWLEATDDEGNRRIDNPEDRHRREIETAINRRIRIFVALMEDAHMPRKKQLPPVAPGEEPRGVQLVPALHALRIADFAFDYGIEELITNIERATEQAHVSEEALQREAEEQERAEEEERKDAEESAEAKRRSEAEERRRAEEERKPAAEERKAAGEGEATRDREEGRRRLLTLAGVGLGIVAVVVVAYLIASSGDEDGSATVVGAAVPVGDHPVDLAYGEGGLWVSNRRDGSVSLIPEDDPAEADTMEIGSEPEGVAVGGGFLYVADRGEDVVWSVDPPSGEPMPIQVEIDPSGVAYSEDGVWVANLGSGTVSRIASPGDVEPFRVGNQPYGVAIGFGSVWVTNRPEDADGTVSRIEPTSGREIDRIPVGPVGAEPRGIAVSTDAVWVANPGDDTVTRIDPDSGEPEEFEFEDGTMPRDVVEAFGSIWVSNGGSDSVSRIDAEDGNVIETIDVGAGPEGITAGPDSIWVANGEADTVTRIRP
jgi:YVTN family beta-propeller protein